MSTKELLIHNIKSLIDNAETLLWAAEGREQFGDEDDDMTVQYLKDDFNNVISQYEHLKIEG